MLVAAGDKKKESMGKKKLLNCYEMLIHELLVCNWYVINIP